MTDNLYGSSSLAIRELIQNGLDALRHRRAIHAVDGSEFSVGKLSLTHGVDGDGQHFVRCTDSGIGMDATIITTFLTNVGRSYYRSAAFEQERVRFRDADVDFDPCARFGIGFMSAFMLGDHVRIETRRDDGPSKGHGAPWIVEIQGIGGMVIIRNGTELQPVGTSVTITLREKPTFVDSWSDPVQLLEVATGYALSTDFPIECECTVPGIEGSAIIPTGLAPVETVLARAEIEHKVEFTQDFSEIDPRLNGVVKHAFLLDPQTRLPTLENDEGAWVRKQRRTDFQPKKEMEKYWDLYHIDDGQTCLDGILVCGSPGREDKARRLGSRANAIKLPSPFVLDICGDLKPRLKPDRTPLQRRSMDNPPDWARIQAMADLAHGRICERLADYLEAGLSPEVFWTICVAHGLWVPTMRTSHIWKVPFPLKARNNTLSWQTLEEIGTLHVGSSDEERCILSTDEKLLRASKSMNAWDSEHSGVNWYIEATATCCGRLTVDGDALFLAFSTPSDSESSPWFRRLRSRHSGDRCAIKYDDQISDCISAAAPIQSVNELHPVVQHALDAEFEINPTVLQEFATSLSWCLSDREILDRIGGKKSPTRWMKFVAHRYLAVDWSRYEHAFQPPYAVWISGSKVAIDADTLNEWANATVEDDE